MPAENKIMDRRKKCKRLSVGIVMALAATWLVVPVGCSVFGIRTSEEASYKVLREDEHIEVREYDELVLAQTTVDADFDEAGSIAFRRLFRYISGANAAETEIAMTAPVVADPAEAARGEKIDMTAPVVGQPEREGWSYTFVLPSAYTTDSAPAPTDPTVKLVAVPRTTVAALRYSGSWSEETMNEKSRELLEWIETNGFAPASTPRVAGYDPPWTIPFLRRNEVLIDIK